METRKLQQVGGGTYTVSVPKEWADEHRLEVGNTIHLYTHDDGSLVVRTAPKDGGALDAARVEIPGREPALVERALEAVYAIGFEKVTLDPADRFTDEQRRAANETVGGLVGMEVVGEGEDELAVRNLLDASNVSVRQSVVQLQFTTLSIHRRATAGFADADERAYDRLRERDDEVDRLTAMISRHFNRSLVSLEEIDRLRTNRSELFDYYVTARQLERVADRGVDVARVAERMEEPPGDDVTADVLDAAEAARDVVDDAVSAVLGETGVDGARDVLARRDETIEAVDSITRERLEGECAGQGATLLALSSVGRTASLGGEIGEVAIRAAFRSEELDGRA